MKPGFATTLFWWCLLITVVVVGLRLNTYFLL